MHNGRLRYTRSLWFKFRNWQHLFEQILLFLKDENVETAAGNGIFTHESAKYFVLMVTRGPR